MWIIDSNVFYYIYIEKSWFTTRRSYEVDIFIISFLTISEGIGTVVLIFDDYELTFINVIYVSRLKINVLSTERLKKDNYIDYFKVLKTYYAETVVKPISFDLAYRRLRYISKKLIKQLVNKRVIDLKLKPKSAGCHN